MFKFRKEKPDSIKRLYEVFGNYTPEHLDCCACCHDKSYVNLLKTTPLNSLTETHLTDYFDSALYTCAGTDAFKYFLPRLFEAEMDLWQFQAKFEYVDWKNTWSADEISAVEDHIFSEWCAGKRPYEFEDYLIFFPFSRLLKLWKNDSSSMTRLIDSWSEFFSEEGRWSLSVVIAEEEKAAILTFLETLYVKYMDIDSTYAEKISRVHYYLGWFPT